MNRKTIFGSLSALAVILLAAASFAQGADRVTAEIPFEFTAGTVHYPAGTYVFEINDPDHPNVLTVDAKDGTRSQFILGKETEAERAHYNSAVVFDEIGNERFLVKAYVSGKMGGLRLTKSEIQRELEAAGQKAHTLEIEANPPT